MLLLLLPCWGLCIELPGMLYWPLESMDSCPSLSCAPIDSCEGWIACSASIPPSIPVKLLIGSSIITDTSHWVTLLDPLLLLLLHHATVSSCCNVRSPGHWQDWYRLIVSSGGSRGKCVAGPPPTE